MDLKESLSSIKFSDHILKFQNNEITGSFDSSVFPLEQKEIPKKISDWIDQITAHSIKIIPSNKSLETSSIPHSDQKKGLIIWLKEGEKKDIQINYIPSNKDHSAVIKNFILLEKNSSLNWIENYLHHAHSSIRIENYIYIQEKAGVFSLKIDQGEDFDISSQNQFKNQNNKVSLHKQSRIKQNTSSQNQSIVFCDLHEHSSFFSLDINLNSTSKQIYIHNHKPHCSSIVRGLNLLTKNQKADQLIFNQKDGVSSYSRQFYRNVLSGRSKNTLHSRITVNAQQTNSNQLIQSLILSPRAKTYYKPELIIKKDQVIATHGATTGRPNPMEMFYLNTRGLSNETALEFLVTGWINQIFQINDQDKKRLPLSFEEFQQKINKPIQYFLYKKIKNILSEKENSL